VEHIVDVALPQSATMAERMYRLAWLVGGDDAGEPNGKLWSSLADRREAAKLTGEDVRPLAVLHVGAPMAASAWSNIADVLDGAGMRVAIVGENVDVDLAHDVTIDARCAPIDLAGKMSVGAMVGVLERAVLFVGPDRGPATLAALLEVRSVIAGVGVSEELASSPSRRVVMCRGDDQTQQVRAHAAITSEVSIAALAAMEQWRAQRV
jgi:ADP-heptose:LPS heptosyltransferase